jgi:hypothetical protein
LNQSLQPNKSDFEGEGSAASTNARRIRRIHLSAAFLVLIVTAVVFQNCGTYQADNSPLYNVSLPSTCVGVTCQADLNSIQIKIANNIPITIKRPDATGGTPPVFIVPTDCNLSSCIEVSGYCDMGGYTSSVFYIELTVPQAGVSTSLIPRQRTTAQCNELGRFNLTIQVPTSFNYSTLYNLIVTMTAVDDQAVEVENPSGQNRQQISVMGRIDPTPTP